MNELEKFCGDCQTSLPLDCFNSAGQGTRLRPQCKACTRKRELSRMEARRAADGPKPSHRTCSRCKEELPFDDKHFKRRKDAPYGLSPECKQCHKARAIDWLKTPRAKESRKRWVNANRDLVRSYALASQKRRRQKVNAYVNTWRLANLEKVRESNRLSARRNHLQRAAYRHRRRAAGSVDAAQIRDLQVLQRDRCAICKARLFSKFEVDHIVPIALGGDSNPSNLQLLCRTCNRSKGACHPVDYMQRKGFLL